MSPKTQSVGRQEKLPLNHVVAYRCLGQEPRSAVGQGDTVTPQPSPPWSSWKGGPWRPPPTLQVVVLWLIPGQRPLSVRGGRGQWE